MKKLKFKNIKFTSLKIINPLRYEGFILIGFVIAFGALIKILGIYNFSSDWFWFLAGIGLIVEGTISWIKQRRFDRKYKIIERSEIKKRD